jgi:hypothetical protein
MLELDGKKEKTSLGICQFWHKEMVYKSGRIEALIWTKMDCRNCISCTKRTFDGKYITPLD